MIHNPLARGTALIVLSAFSFGSLSTLTVLAIDGGLPLLPAMMWRYLLAILLLLPLAGKRVAAVPPRKALQLILLGALGQATISFMSLTSLDYISVGSLGFLFYTYPAWVAVITAAAGREEITARKMMALLLAMSGIVAMIGTPFSADLHAGGVLLGLGSALLFAIYLPLLHGVQHGVDSRAAAFYLVAGVALSFTLASLMSGTILVPETLSLWALVITLAFVGTVVAFFTMIAGLRLLGPLRTAIVGTVEPFFTAMLGVAVLQEPFTLTTLAGGSMIAAAVVMLTLAPPSAAFRSR